MAELLGLACEKEPLQALLLHMRSKNSSTNPSTADGYADGTEFLKKHHACAVVLSNDDEQHYCIHTDDCNITVHEIHVIVMDHMCGMMGRRL